MVAVRTGQAEDLAQVNEVYNHYVVHTHITFDVEPITMEQRLEWFSHYEVTGRHRLLVAVEGETVLGCATSSPHHPRPAYETSVETSIYLRPDATGQRVGTALYGALFAALDGEDVHRAYAGIGLPNPASIALHERFGFTKAGHYTEQGRKFDRYWDVAWYEKPLS